MLRSAVWIIGRKPHFFVFAEQSTPSSLQLTRDLLLDNCLGFFCQRCCSGMTALYVLELPSHANLHPAHNSSPRQFANTAPCRTHRVKPVPSPTMASHPLHSVLSPAFSPSALSPCPHPAELGPLYGPPSAPAPGCWCVFQNSGHLFENNQFFRIPAETFDRFLFGMGARGMFFWNGGNGDPSPKP